MKHMVCIICKEGMFFLKDDLYYCEHCNHVSSNIDPDPSIYDRSYTIKYSRYEHSELNEKIQNERFLSLPSVESRGRILDFGCGVGSFVNYANCHGSEAAGFDINPYSCYCNIEYLFKYKYSTLTLWDSIEHLRNPAFIINGINPKHLVVSTPCTDDSSHLDLTKWKHYMPNEHCHYFSQQSLLALFKLLGFVPYTINFNESKHRIGDGKKNIITIGGTRETTS